MSGRRRRARLRLYHLLLLLPLLALWVPFYNRVEPTLMGVPFFYWFQMAWIGVGMLVLLIVYFLEHHTGDRL